MNYERDCKNSRSNRRQKEKNKVFVYSQKHIRSALNKLEKQNNNTSSNNKKD